MPKKSVAFIIGLILFMGHIAVHAQTYEQNTEKLEWVFKGYAQKYGFTQGFVKTVVWFESTGWRNRTGPAFDDAQWALISFAENSISKNGREESRIDTFFRLGYWTTKDVRSLIPATVTVGGFSPITTDAIYNARSMEELVDILEIVLELEPSYKTSAEELVQKGSDLDYIKIRKRLAQHIERPLKRLASDSKDIEIYEKLLARYKARKDGKRITWTTRLIHNAQVYDRTYDQVRTELDASFYPRFPRTTPYADVVISTIEEVWARHSGAPVVIQARVDAVENFLRSAPQPGLKMITQGQWTSEHLYKIAIYSQSRADSYSNFIFRYAFADIATKSQFFIVLQALFDALPAWRKYSDEARLKGKTLTQVLNENSIDKQPSSTLLMMTRRAMVGLFASADYKLGVGSEEVLLAKVLGEFEVWQGTSSASQLRRSVVGLAVMARVAASEVVGGSCAGNFN